MFIQQMEPEQAEKIAAARKELQEAGTRVANKQLAAMTELILDMQRICPHEGHAAVRVAMELRAKLSEGIAVCDHAGEPFTAYVLRLVASTEELIWASKAYDAAVAAARRLNPGVQ